MSVIERSALVPRPAAQMYTLVNAVEDYPRRFTWCVDAAVLEDAPDQRVARLDLRVAGLKLSFVTRNRLHPGERIEMALVEGPFRSLAGQWRFVQLGQLGCRVSLHLDFEPDSRLLGAAVRAGFSSLADRLVADFCAEALRGD